MNKSIAESLSEHVERYDEALNKIPTVDLATFDDAHIREYEEYRASRENDPETIVFDEGVRLLAVAGAVTAWFKLPESDATRERLGQMIDKALIGSE